MGVSAIFFHSSPLGILSVRVIAVLLVCEIGRNAVQC